MMSSMPSSNVVQKDAKGDVGVSEPLWIGSDVMGDDRSILLERVAGRALRSGLSITACTTNP